MHHGLLQQYARCPKWLAQAQATKPLLSRGLLAAPQEADILQQEGEPPLPKRVSWRSDVLQIGRGSESGGAGGHKRKRPFAKERAGPAEDRRYGKSCVAAQRLAPAFCAVSLHGRAVVQVSAPDSGTK